MSTKRFVRMEHYFDLGSQVMGANSVRIVRSPHSHRGVRPRAVGIEVLQTKLIDIRDVHGLPAEAGNLKGKALAVERFDRAALRNDVKALVGEWL